MTPDDMEAVIWRLERDVSGSRAAALGTINVGQRDLRALLLAYQERGRALEKLANATPSSANTRTTGGFVSYVHRIARTTRKGKSHD